MKKLIVLFCIICSSCSFEIESPLPESDLIVATANIYIDNANYRQAVSTTFDIDADVIVFNETGGKSEIFATLAEEKGYICESFTETDHNAFLLEVAVKEDIELIEFGCKTEVFLGYGWLPQVLFPVCRIKVKDHTFSIIGAHVPTPLSSSVTERVKLIQPLLDSIKEGKLVKDYAVGKTGDYVIFTGDFNMFTFDIKRTKILQKGMEDSHRSDPHLVNHTWKEFARIDYIFYTEALNNNFSGTFEIPGSDHRGVIAGFEF